MRMQIKALSVNAAWLGRKRKSAAYRQYELELLALLPDITLGPAPYSLCITFGYSSKLADIDNGIKCLLDCCQKRYCFNDRDIYIMHVYKVDVKKGEEYIDLEIETIINSKRVM